MLPFLPRVLSWALPSPMGRSNSHYLLQFPNLQGMVVSPRGAGSGEPANHVYPQGVQGTSAISQAALLWALAEGGGALQAAALVLVLEDG